MTVPKYNTEYYEGITAPYVDWVGGGNFDGYLVQKKIIFQKIDNKVELHTEVVNKKNYDGNVENTVIIGTYKQTEKDTLTLTFNEYEMRGKFLGDKNEIIVFSVWGKQINKTEVFKINE